VIAPVGLTSAVPPPVSPSSPPSSSVTLFGMIVCLLATLSTHPDRMDIPKRMMSDRDSKRKKNLRIGLIENYLEFLKLDSIIVLDF
jgi:hypothetical protein